jgi:cellulose synthase/poly-beta-1,6-N-acetylglucosamine synthase-like glycosyltransferase
MAAHNEAAVIGSSIASATRLVPPERIFVTSDGSTDDTVRLVRDAGANVLDLQPNRGKAGALAAGVAHFRLAERFAVVLILDADTELDADYLRTGLPLFADPRVAVVAGRATTQWHLSGLGPLGRTLLMHRERIYAVVQRLVKYGQGLASVDAITIAPGFASMYRGAALRSVEMNPPGLVIEDFNMTFEIHRRRLGRIAFHPKAAVARTQDPATLREYSRQVRRWALGFWQTIRLHRLWHPGVFWFALCLYCAELVSSAIALVAAAAVILLALAVHAIDGAGAWLALPGWLPSTGSLLLAVIVPDLLLTCTVALGQRRLAFLVAAPAYPFLRLLDAWMCLAALARSGRTTSTGRWTSPTRRPNIPSAAPTTTTPTVGGCP